MAEPEVTYEREHGGTNDHNRLRVSLRRKAVLTDDLRHVTERRDATIFLTTRQGYVPSHKYGIQPEQVVFLIAALESALADWHDLAPAAPPPDPPDREAGAAVDGVGL